MNIRVDLIPNIDNGERAMSVDEMDTTYQALQAINPSSLASQEIDQVYENAHRLRRQMLEHLNIRLGERTRLLRTSAISHDENELRYQEERAIQFRANGLARLMEQLDKLP